MKRLATIKHCVKVVLLRVWNRLAPFIGDMLFLEVKFWLRVDYWPRVNHPKTFNEKLQWLKLYNRKSLYTDMVDKYKSKNYVKEKVGEEYVVPTLGVWDTPDDIDFETLPNQFVLKVTHDSGGIVICQDKKYFDKEKAIKVLKRGLQRNYYKINREWPYKNVSRKVIAEKFLGDNLQDYRVYCFNGVPKLIYSYTNKSEADGSKPEPTYCDIMDTSWNPVEFRQMCKPRGGVPKPQHLLEMLEIATILSQDIPFLRVDFYEGEHLLVGELTFFPGSGMSKFFPLSADEELGSWIKLKTK